jgi:hypothetical protein
MTTASVNPVTCAGCGVIAPMHTMLLNDQGAVSCQPCLAKEEAKAGLRKRTRNNMLAPAMVSLLAWFSLIIPLINLAAPGVLSAVALWSAIGGVRVYNELGRRRDDHGVSAGLRSGLLVMSILTIIFASILLVMQILGWIALALAPSYPRY